MKLSSVILRVENMDESKSFWSEVVGLGVLVELPAFTFLDGGGTPLILSHIDAEVNEESLTEVVFESDEVRSEYDEMAERGVPFELELRPITTDRERQLFGAHFRDPDGHYGSLTGWVDSG
jgi:catechol 2,3-dioxygenase-like lactoylglutathione lyase family enzyme